MAKLPAKGATLKIGSTEIAQVVRIGELSMTQDAADVTLLGDSYRSWLPAINEWQEVECEVLYDPDAATHVSVAALRASLLGTTTLQSMVLTFTDTTPTTATFNAYLSNWSAGPMEVGEAIHATFTFKISGDVTFA